MSEVASILGGKSFSFEKVSSIEVELGRLGYVKLWDLNSRDILETLSLDSQHTQPLLFNISSDDTFCIGGWAHEGVIDIWDLTDKEKCRSISIQVELSAVAISLGRNLIAAAAKSNIFIFSAQTLQTLIILDCESDVWGIQFSPDDSQLFGACSGYLISWDIKNIASEPGSRATASHVQFSGYGGQVMRLSGSATWLLSLSDDGDVHAANLTTKSAGGKAQLIGGISATSRACWMDLGLVSDEGTGYAVSHPDTPPATRREGESWVYDLVICMYAAIIPTSGGFTESISREICII
ncbi:hypothetical protein FRB99_007637 [Tulasnella sp. 403]|nr:hypothetical protein FRB99_007637 [Tulasnella sp. 403]